MVPAGTSRQQQVPGGTSGYQRVPVYQVPVYEVYHEDQDQISGATYISDVVFNSMYIRDLGIIHKLHIMYYICCASVNII